MQNVEGFTLRQSSVVCPECKTVFATHVLEELPPVTELDIIEADMHRVLPEAKLRGALICVCPFCQYADWTTKFSGSIINPDILPLEDEVQHSRKFAMAVKYARNKGLAALDIAYIALNGLYCAREAGEAAEPWLELCVYEHGRGMESEDLIWQPATSHDHLVMAELWRQVRHFDKALISYELAREDGTIPTDLINHQINISRAGDSNQTVLPPYLVRILFPEAALAGAGTTIDGKRSVPAIVTRKPELIWNQETEPSGPPARKRPVWKNQDQPDSAGKELIDVEVAFVESTAPVEEERLTTRRSRKKKRAAALIERDQVAAVSSSVPTDTVPHGIPPAPPIDVTPPAPLAGVASAVQPSSVPANEFSTDALMNRVRNVIATPHGASSVSLVQASQVNGTVQNIHVSGGPQQSTTNGAHLPAMDSPTNDIFVGAMNPAKAKKDDATSRAVRKAMRAAKETEEDDHFPEIQICDEDSGYAYTNVQRSAHTQQSKQQQQQVAIPAQQYLPPTSTYDDENQYNDTVSAPESSEYDYSNSVDDSEQSAVTQADAVAQVESFLSLTRQPSYQNWIRGYRK